MRSGATRAISQGARRASQYVRVLLLPDYNPTGAIYGTLVVGVLLAVESAIHEDALRDIAAAMAALTAHWLGHAYAHCLARRLATDGTDDGRGFLWDLRHEWTVVRGGFVPVIVFALALAVGLSTQRSVLVALACSFVLLVTFEVTAATRKQIGLADLGKQVLICVLIFACILVIKYSL